MSDLHYLSASAARELFAARRLSSRCSVLTVPAGLSPDRLPIGFSVVARTYDDVTAFAVAAAHEEQLGWWTDGGPRPVL